MTLHMFRIEDGEIAHVIAETSEEALDIWANLSGDEGETGAAYQAANDSQVMQLDGAFMLSVLDDDGATKTSKTCAEWAASEGKGILCASCF